MTAEQPAGFAWPGGASAAVTLTFDVDAEAGWLGEAESYRRRLTTLSEGRFGVVRGMPRILQLLRQHGIPATFFVPGYTAEQHPALVPSILEEEHEIGHHGYLHLRSDKVSPDEQRVEIERGLEALGCAGAPVPRGYRSTSWELTPETFALLIEHDFAYDSSCMGDDRPYFEEHEGNRILELPIHWSLDDWPRFGWSIDAGGNVAEPGELLSSWTSEYEAVRGECRHLILTMHPEVIGRAYRLAALEGLIERIQRNTDVWFATLEQVADHVRPLLDSL
jgi:peptidoglycan/xylan/chitin deacetylase (PgdA/CDA1 family)